MLLLILFTVTIFHRKEVFIISTTELLVQQMQTEMDNKNIMLYCGQFCVSLCSRIQDIDTCMSATEGRPVIDHTMWRIKSAESIVKKLQRKGRDISLETAMETLHDIMGIRIICPFQDDVFHVTEAVKSMDNLEIINIKNFISHPKRSGYRSIHIICRADVPGIGKSFLEIQLRSVAMNYWAILDHLLCYKNENKKVQNLRKELKKCALEIADIDKRFYRLRKRIEKLSDQDT